MNLVVLALAVTTGARCRKLQGGRKLSQAPAACMTQGLSYDPGSYNQPSCPAFTFCQDLGIQESNNCYSYAIDDLQDPDRDAYSIFKPLPGDYRGEFLLPFQFTCPDLVGKIRRDFPEIQAAQREQACPCGFYKVILLLDTEAYRTADGRDFHLARQDSDGFYSHKIGSAPVVNVDASEQRISDPFTANWNYSQVLRFGGFWGHAYSPCEEGLFCVPLNTSQTAQALREAIVIPRALPNATAPSPSSAPPSPAPNATNPVSQPYTVQASPSSPSAQPPIIIGVASPTSDLPLGWNATVTAASGPPEPQHQGTARPIAEAMQDYSRQLAMKQAAEFVSNTATRIE